MKKPQKSKIFQNWSKNPKILKNLIFFFSQKKKCYPLSFPALGGRNLTRALQSSPIQKYENLTKSQKFTFF